MTAPRAEGFAFRVLHTDGHARRSVLTTPHAVVELPTFMPVGTQGSVKTLTPDEVASTGAQIVLGNTYHLWLRPGPDAIAAHGGLHGFTQWPRASAGLSTSAVRSIASGSSIFWRSISVSKSKPVPTLPA